MTTPGMDDTLAARIASLQQKQPWLDPAATVTLAASPTSNDEAHGIADSLRQQVSQVWDGISHFFDDPVLQQKETPNLQLQRYITGTTGPLPVEDRSLIHIQQQLQAKGFGQGLTASGKWDAGWQTALQQHTLDAYNKEIAGNKPGSKSSTGFLHSVLDSISPSGVADSVVGFVKSIPGDVRQAAVDAGGAFSELGHGAEQLVTHPGDLLKQGGDVGEKTRRDRAAGQVAVDNALGGDLTQQEAQAKAGSMDDLTNTINDIGTVFLLSGAAGAARAAAGAFSRETVAKGGAGLLARDAASREAQRSAGTIAKSLMKPVVTRTAAGAAVGGAVGGGQAALRGGDIGQGVGEGIVLGGLTGGLGGKSTRVRESAPVRAAQAATDKALAKILPDSHYRNLPIHGNTGPIIGKLTDDQGLYYRARTRLATPYQLGAVRATGSAFAQAQAFSLKAHGTAYLEHLFGGDAGEIQQQIENANVLDPINDAIRNRLAFTIAGQHFTPDLDYLMYFLHGPITPGAEGTASRAVGDTVAKTNDGLTDALGHVKFIGQIEKGSGASYEELLKKAGSPELLADWMSNKAKAAAAYLHAEEVWTRGRVVMPGTMPQQFTDDYFNLLRSESNAVMRDPDAMRTALAHLDAEGENYLQNFIKNEMSREQTAPDAYLSHQLGDYLRAGQTLTHEVLPHSEQYLLHPRTVEMPPKGIDPSLYPGNKVPQSLMEQVPMMATGEVIPGSFGIARDTMQSSQIMTRVGQDFARQIEEARALPDRDESEALLQALHEQMNAYLHEHLGLDYNKLKVFDGDPDKAVNLILDRAKQVAADVHLTADAPEDLQAAFGKINGHGYKVVYGTDIGHAFRSDLPKVTGDVMGNPVTRARKIASSLGMNNEMHSRLDYAVDQRRRLVRALQQRVDDGTLTLPPFYTVQTVINDLQNDELVQKELPFLSHSLFSVSRYAHKGAVKDLMEKHPDLTPQGALAKIEADIASASGVRNLTMREMRRVLARTEDTPWQNIARSQAQQVDHPIPLMQDSDIRQVYTAIQEARASTPASIIGAGKVEDFLRYMPFRVRLGDKHLPFGISSLPSTYTRLRDDLRFTLSPYFDLRRVAKTNVKMWADGVPGTVHPVAELKRRGEWDLAHAKLDELQGGTNAKYKFLDENDRYLDGRGIFGLYNKRHFEAYYVAQKLEAGASDAEIHEGLVRVFEYGVRGREGRTALERTTNTIFFPFSFEKTVIRNVGGYLLDKPAQAMILSSGLQAYRDFSQNHQNNPLSQEWIAKHTPLMEEALRLNTFAHGISPGELGGVNRPLLNMFLPQSWDSDKHSVQTLQRFVPLVADLHRIVNESKDQTYILNQSVKNGLDQILNGSRASVLVARPVAEGKQQQLDDARVYRSQLIAAFEKVLDYNASVGSDDEKVTWGLGEGVPAELRGQPINRTTLGQVVHNRYPAYDPLAGAGYAISKKVSAEQWLSKRVGTEQYPAYKDFYDKAQTAIAHLNKDDYPDEQAAQVQDLFRQQAINFGEKDPAFVKWYQHTFASAFGPLTAVK